MDVQGNTPLRREVPSTAPADGSHDGFLSFSFVCVYVCTSVCVRVGGWGVGVFESNFGKYSLLSGVSIHPSTFKRDPPRMHARKNQ